MTVLFEANERVEARFPQSKEWIAYNATIQIENSKAHPVRMELEFIPPHPFFCNMPITHSIKGDSITNVYVKLAKFFRTYGCEFGW